MTRDMQEIKDWLYIGGFIAAAVALFWKTILGGDKDVKEWADKRFVSKELFDIHLLQLQKDVSDLKTQQTGMHSENREWQVAILNAVGGTPPNKLPNGRRERPSDPGRRT